MTKPSLEMPRQRGVSCENNVKLHVKALGHLKCCSDRPCSFKEGKWLNHVMNDNKFVDEKMYRVCDVFVRRNNSSSHFGKSKSSIEIDNNQPFSVGSVKIIVNESEMDPIALPSKKKAKGCEKNLFGEFCNGNIMRKKFMDLCVKRRKERIKLGSQIVLKMCSGIDDFNNIKEKNDVGNDVIIFLDTIKEYIIQDVLKLNLKDLIECNYERPPEEEIPDVAVTLLTKCTRREYKTLKTQVEKDFNLPEASIPSHYQMTKGRPEFTEHEVIVEKVEVESVEVESDSEYEGDEDIKKNLRRTKL